MRKKIYILFWAVIIFHAADLAAQQTVDSSVVAQRKVGQQCLWIHNSQEGDSIFLDSLSLVPGSLSIQGSASSVSIDTSSFNYNYSSGMLWLSPTLWSTYETDSIRVCYRTLSFSFHTVTQHKSLSLYDSSALFDDARFKTIHQEGLPKEELFATPNLQKSGSISRGVSFGNRQDVFVNADLNLQLEGALTDDLNIRAAITDQNIPLQPEGNTQQLQDFDNVLIELYNDHFSLAAGDVLLQSSSESQTNPVQDTALHDISSHFLQYRRNVQGGQLRTAYSLGKNGKAQTTLGAALSKGRFASVTLEVQEGVQGPYILKAPGQNQRGVDNMEVGNAFYILTNSEKVYLDGRLLERGYDRDYIIDYNLGEITFTAQVLITKYSRVSIDYEYADRTYSRSILNARHTQKHGKITLYMDFYREKDNPNQPLAYDLDNDDKQLLNEVGDNISEAYVLAADSVVDKDINQRENANQANIPGRGTLPEIFYLKKDTIAGGIDYQIFEYTTQKEGVYRVSFSLVGLGNGDYELSTSTVNGRVYEWVAPVNGQKQGMYAPIRLISTPKSKQVVSLGTTIEITQKDKIFAEVAFSNYDKNLFSEKDASDDQGQALRIGYKSEPRDVKWLQGYHWNNQLSYEYRQKHFAIIDPYRSVEFERNWSSNVPVAIIPQDNAFTDDHLLDFRTQLQKDNYNHLKYHFSSRNKGVALAGIQNTLEVAQQVGKLQIDADAFLLNTRQYDFQSDWKRMRVDAHWHTQSVMPGYVYRFDRNSVRKIQKDSVQYSAINFEEHQFYLQSSDSLSGNFRVDYSFRTDQSPYLGKLVKSDQSHTANARYNAHIHKDHQLGILFTYRSLQILNDSIKAENQPINSKEESILGKMNWSGSFLENAIRSSLDYSIGNGRELKREFIYVKVPPGEGPYTWRDDNGNGVEEIEEFYEALYPDERNYARVYIASGEYILAFTNTFNYRLNIQPPNAWHGQQGMKKLLGMFSANASWSANKKTDDARLGKRLNPFAGVDDAHLLYIREVLQSSVFFNRRNPKYGADYSLRQSKRKQLLNVGFDERSLSSHQLNLRYNIHKIWQLQWQLEKQQSISILQSGGESQGKSRSYWIESYGISPQVAWQPGLNFRLIGKYTYDYKQDDSQRLEKTASAWPDLADATIQTMGLETRWSKMIQSALNASLEFVNIKYAGDPNTPIAYEMLEALRPGHNLRWMLNWQQKIIDGLQLSVNYHGRKSPEQAVIHTGSVQVRALF